MQCSAYACCSSYAVRSRCSSQQQPASLHGSRAPHAMLEYFCTTLRTLLLCMFCYSAYSAILASTVHVLGAKSSMTEFSADAHGMRLETCSFKTSRPMKCCRAYTHKHMLVSGCSGVTGCGVWCGVCCLSAVCCLLLLSSHLSAAVIAILEFSCPFGLSVGPIFVYPLLISISGRSNHQLGSD